MAGRPLIRSGHPVERALAVAVAVPVELADERIPAGTFADARVQQLQLLTVEDIEIIAGLADNEEVDEIIASKARSDHRELSMVRWLSDTPDSDPPRHPELEARWS